MDFIEWSDAILRRFVRDYERAGMNRTVGLGEHDIATVWGWPLYQAPAYDQIRGALLDALSELSSSFLLEEQSTTGYYRPTEIAIEHQNDLTPLWRELCKPHLSQDEAHLLAVVAELSERCYAAYAELDWIEHGPIIEAAAWPEGMDRVYAVADDLKRKGLIGMSATMGPSFRAHATYRGLVWLRKQGDTLEAEFLDRLIAEGETTSVEFKRELHTDTNDQKAEFVKDVLALATTQASGDRWLIVGFDETQGSWWGTPDPKITQDHLEQLLSQYTDPVVLIRFSIVDYRGKAVAKLQVLRDRSKIPYAVKRELRGEKRRIVAGQMFVRHGSQVEQPTPGELEALQKEGERARSERAN